MDHRAQVCTLVPVAVETGVSQVFGHGQTKMFAAQYVVHLAAVVEIRLVDQTIFADMIRPVSYKTTQRLADVTAHEPAIGVRALWLNSSEVPNPRSDQVHAALRV